jgi:hypothetical protein
MTTMQKKKTTRRPVKPPRQEFRAWAGSAIRVTFEAHRPVPLVMKDLIRTATKGG